ncbi:glycoside hydrolase family 43 protein [Bifidobacterium sp. ESL0704]|uniref:glycoside hydrolase family 43 protein n=1 Tax=Bifidobacterium sp. ESL0704 TaxID=2983219 RepID=UPI0023F89F9E|nr:glycoside hydrolase family 43 protein [Bifidobacterium sp. ESL0704]WEV53082.1 glycoside hydrolase family 43 protein [Bifidobacterium sp. ESL0704]
MAISTITTRRLPVRVPHTPQGFFEFPLPKGRVPIHDPAIAEENGVYYLFGTHRRFARSTDLVNWEPMSNNLTDDFETLLGPIWQQWPQIGLNGSPLSGNTWAPDVIFNPTMGKWCMYLSVNGEHYQSVIVLLTADHLENDWTYVGPVVYSGFKPDNVKKTDVPRVLGDEASGPLTRYQSLKDSHINAIDAAPVIDERGDMWMSFGSWFGGLWMIRLDPKTGLRDYTTTYPLVHDASDPYYGIKIGGGYSNSGEGSYFLNANGWWYLMLSYGGLGRTGGYQIRVFRSRNLTGPYLDQAGNPAISHGEIADNWTGKAGVRLLASVAWSGGFTKAGQTTNPTNPDGKDETTQPDWDDVEISQGHNSALMREDGRMFMVYHTRFIGRDDNDYETRVRELYATDDGWLVAAPYEYSGAVGIAPHNPAEIASIAGDYELTVLRQDTYFDGTHDENGHWHGVNTPVHIRLHSNGRVSGEDPRTLASAGIIGNNASVTATDGNITCGQWRLSGNGHTLDHRGKGGAGTGDICGNGSMRITLGTTTYTGVFAVLPRESDGKPAMTFSALGNNLCIWGARQ